MRTIAIRLGTSLRRQKRIYGFDPARGFGIIRPADLVDEIIIYQLEMLAFRVRDQ